MSTRSMTIVAQRYSGEPKFIPLYRHCDGYPAEAGAAIVTALNARPTDPESVVAGLLAQRYERDGGGSETIYRLATWQPEDQGDLEHVYIIEPAASVNGGVRVRAEVMAWTVRHCARPPRSWSEGHDDYRNWPAQTYSLAEFVEVVNRDRQAINRRLASLRAQQPGAYGDAAEYPMVTA